MEGAAGVSQCPLPPGLSMTYNFTVSLESSVYLSLYSFFLTFVILRPGTQEHIGITRILEAAILVYTLTWHPSFSHI